MRFDKGTAYRLTYCAPDNDSEFFLSSGWLIGQTVLVIGQTIVIEGKPFGQRGGTVRQQAVEVQPVSTGNRR
jgi:hypothetical protein